jgi:hypothetical protein
LHCGLAGDKLPELGTVVSANTPLSNSGMGTNPASIYIGTRHHTTDTGPTDPSLAATPMRGRFHGMIRPHTPT